MSPDENKAALRRMMEAVAQGDCQSFFDLQADHFEFAITGHSQWSKTFKGKQLIRETLFEPLFQNFAERYSAELVRFVAEDDHVVVEFRGHVMTTVGNLYNNEHCWVCRLEDGKLKSVREYADSLLVHRVISAVSC